MSKRIATRAIILMQRAKKRQILDSIKIFPLVNLKITELANCYNLEVPVYCCINAFNYDEQYDKLINALEKRLG
jgi:hypothetical protein